MKVLIIAQYFPPDMGGGATRAYNAARGLSKNNCDVTIISAVPHYPTGDIPKEYRMKPLSVEYDGEMRVIRTFILPLASEGLVKRMLLFASFVISSLFALPFVGNVDVIWAANPNVISFYPSLFYSLVKHCPLIQNVDDLWPEALHDLGVPEKSFVSKLGELAAGTVYKFASFITPISSDHVSIIASKYHVKRSKICVVPAGVDLDKFNGRQKNSLSGKLTVLYIGAFSPAYDFDQVLKAAKLLSTFPDVEFVIQGGGELSAILQSEVKKWELSNVKMVERIVSRDEVARMLNEAWAALLPLKGSVEMGISSKLYEYQAARKPIVCCSKGQQGRYVSETKSGIVVKPGDYEALAKAILYLRENRDLADRLGASGRQYVENNLSIERIGFQMKDIFRLVIAG
jgi:glycosyltransferase involved in cell wall biosynthesis